MTEFDSWRLARQEADRLLHSLAAVPATRPMPPSQRGTNSPWQRPAEAARAALRRLRPGRRR